MEGIILLLKALFVIFYVFFLPGFAVSLLIFPKKEELDEWERVGLAFGLGVVLTPLTMFLLISLFNIRMNELLVALISTLWIVFSIGFYYKKYRDLWWIRCIPLKLKQSKR